jgi:hypothetical protein
MINRDVKACINCQHHHVISNDYHNPKGECRKNPPVVQIQPLARVSDTRGYDHLVGGGSTTMFPTVQPTTWCGEMLSKYIFPLEDSI